MIMSSVPYSEGMALGALDALSENGLVPGEDVQIYTTGGSEEVLRLFGEDMIRVLVRCNPDDVGAEVVNSAAGLIDNSKAVQDVSLRADTMVGI